MSTCTVKPITDKTLCALAEYINEIRGLSKQPYIDGIPQAGSYHIDRVYKAVDLARMSLTPGGTGTFYCSLVSFV